MHLSVREPLKPLLSASLLRTDYLQRVRCVCVCACVRVCLCACVLVCLCAAPTVAEGCEASWAALPRCVPSGVPQRGPGQFPGCHCSSSWVHIHTGEVWRLCTYLDFILTMRKFGERICHDICEKKIQREVEHILLRVRGGLPEAFFLLVLFSLIVNKWGITAEERFISQTNSTRHTWAYWRVIAATYKYWQ